MSFSFLLTFLFSNRKFRAIADNIPISHFTKIIMTHLRAAVFTNSYFEFAEQLRELWNFSRGKNKYFKKQKRLKNLKIESVAQVEQSGKFINRLRIDRTELSISESLKNSIPFLPRFLMTKYSSTSSASPPFSGSRKHCLQTVASRRGTFFVIKRTRNSSKSSQEFFILPFYWLSRTKEFLGMKFEMKVQRDCRFI